MSNPTALVQKLWNYCNILRDDGLSYGDYVEQLTFLLFLKMADEQSRPPFNKPSPIPKDKDWPAFLAKDGDELEIHYRHTLEELGKRSGMLGVIFRRAQNKIQDPAKLRRLIVDLIDKEQWSSLSADLKGDVYEGLLQKNAEDVKGGAGETIRRELLKQADVHTLLRLPTGILCAQVVKANVLFFDRKPAQEKPWTQKLWIYDLRTNRHFTLKERTLKRSDLDDFVACYFGQSGSGGSGVPPLNQKKKQSRDGSATSSRHNRVETERFKSFTCEELTKREKVNLDLFGLNDDALEESANRPARKSSPRGSAMIWRRRWSNLPRLRKTCTVSESAHINSTRFIQYGHEC
jgi:hypothetical protein